METSMLGGYMKQTIFLLSSVLLLWGCSDDKGSKPKPKKFTSDTGIIFQDLFQSTQFSVTDENNSPIKMAKILIGQAENDPIQNNLLETDQNGKAKAPKEWKNAQPVTVYAPGYIAVTYLSQTPQSLSFKLRRAATMNRVELKGTTRGYTVRDGDGKVDFGLIMKGLSKADVLAFDINKVISVEMDYLKVAGRDMPVPSNLSLPRQRESYIIPVTIDKNPYRLHFHEAGNHKVIGIRGNFPFQNVVDELRRNKTYADVINYFSLEGGTLQDVNVSTSGPLDLNLSQMNFNSSVPVTGPNVATGEVVIGVVGQDFNGTLMPTDVKRLTPGQTMSLRTTNAASAMILKVLKRESEFDATVSADADRISAVVTNASGNSAVNFLNLIENPKLQGKDLILDVPTAVPNIEAYSTYFILSELQEVDIGRGRKVKVPLHRWEIFAPGWIAQMSLPQRPFSEIMNEQWRWEVSFLGGHESAPLLGPEMIEKTTHVTRSSVDF
jgi:hypothetical protein